MKRTALRSDPATTREFIQRGRESSRLGMSAREALDGMQRTSRALRRGGGKRRAKIPAAVRARVFARSKGKCICGCGQKATHIHHALEVERWPHLELIEANMVGTNHDCNWSHHNAHPRIQRHRLPQCVFDLARELGPKAEDELERYYS